MTHGRSLARSGLLALAIGVATAIVPSAPRAHHDKAVRICEEGDPRNDFYQYWDSSPILIRGAGGRRVGRIAIATPGDWPPGLEVLRGGDQEAPQPQAANGGDDRF